MKKFVIVIVSVVITMSVSAQNLFVHSKEGATLLYAKMNAKGKVEGYKHETIQKVENLDNVLNVSFISIFLNKKRKPDRRFPEVHYTVIVSNGVQEWVLRSLTSPRGKIHIAITGDNIRIPVSLAPGDKLDDINFTALVSNERFTIGAEMSFTNRECLTIEDVTVPAGTYRCYKLKHTEVITAKHRSITDKTSTETILTWYAHGVGEVKSENYNTKGKLCTSKVLQVIEE